MTALREMRPADYPAVAAMADQAANLGLLAMPYWETEREVAESVAALPHAAFLVAEEDGGAVTGMAGFDLRTDREARLFGPLVTAEGHGVGSWLAARTESLAIQEGARAFSMLIGLTNRAGAAWAEWRGYLPDSETPDLLFMWAYPGELNRAPAVPGAAVRPARPGDLDALVQLEEACFPTPASSPGVWRSWLDECRVIELDGKAAGMLRLEASTRFLHHVCVRPEMRRQGLAGHLACEVLGELWEQEPHRVGLTVRRENGPAVDLFRRLGFRREIAVNRWLKRVG